MATKNPRINVTFEETTSGLLSYLAHQEDKPIALLVPVCMVNTNRVNIGMFPV